MKISVIDVGSNSVRLALFAGGKTLYKRLETTRLGKGLSLDGKLTQDAIERTARAVCNFVRVSKEDGAEKTCVFATEAVRSAVNGADFVERVYALCGARVDVLSGEEEAKCGILGAIGTSDGAIIDVGGASTEVTVQKNLETLYSKSVKIGTVRLHDLAGRDKTKLEKVIAEEVEKYGNFSAKGFNVYAIGGTATTLASVKHKLKVYDPAITNGTVLTQAEVKTLADELLGLTVEEVRSLDGMETGRADVIGGGCLLLYSIMQGFEIEKITVSESDNLEGYLALKGELK